jgi:hypothetical protein
MKPDRAWVLLPSGRRLNLLAPNPKAWTDRDLVIGLSRTYRWAGYSAWDLPLSVAQHSLTVLALATREAPAPGLTRAERRRELLHYATEALLGGWDPITPLKPHLGDGFTQLVARLQAAIDIRYRLPAWDDPAFSRHKHADRLAAASEAFHVAGWSRGAMRDDLNIQLMPLEHDPLAPEPGFRPWEPWPPNHAAERFLAALRETWPAETEPSHQTESGLETAP